MALLIRSELTKQFLMSLPTGCFLVSTCDGPSGPHVPRFHERVGPKADSEAQWRRVKAAGADGSLCNVYRSEDLMSEIVERTKLTKSFLMSLGEGMYVASNAWIPVNRGAPTSRFEERVALPQNREAQWTRIKDAGADGRHCNVYDSPDDHTKWLAVIPEYKDKGER